MASRRFNMIFSDALHEPAALRHEYEMILERDLLAEDQFILVWDDLHPGMQPAFEAIVERLKRRIDSRPLQVRLLHINGWVGSAESPHSIGVVTTGIEW